VRVQAEGRTESKITNNIDLLIKCRQEDRIYPVTLNIDRQGQNETEETKYTEESGLIGVNTGENDHDRTRNRWLDWGEHR